MRRVGTLFTSIMVVCVFFCAMPVYGAGIARVIALTGNVEVQREGAVLAMALKDDIFVGDTVQTKADGKVQLLFEDDTTVTLGVNTVFSMDAYSATQNKVFKSNLAVGFARFVTGTIVDGNPETFTIKLPHATAGIRGTTLSGEAARDQSVFMVESSPKEHSVDVNGESVSAGFVMTATATGQKKTPLTLELRQKILQKMRITSVRSIGGANNVNLEKAVESSNLQQSLDNPLGNALKMTVNHEISKQLTPNHPLIVAPLGPAGGQVPGVGGDDDDDLP